MASYSFLVLSNAVDGREDEYNDWYDNRHLPDVLAIPGFVSAQRLVLADTQRAAPPYPWRYMAVYTIETDDLKATLELLKARAGTDAMPMSGAFAPGVAFVYRPIAELTAPGG